MQNNYRYLFFSFLLALFIATTFSIQGGFQDSLVYYEQFSIIKRNGLYESIDLIADHTGKLEPGMFLVFFIQSFFVESLSLFLIVNLLIINLLLVGLYFSYNNSMYGTPRFSYLAITILLLSYYTFSNYIYIWRSIYAFYFIGMYCLSINKSRRFVFLVLSCLFHFSSIVYILLFYMIRTISLNKLSVIVLSFLMSIFIVILLVFVPESVTLLTSGNGQGIFTTVDSEVYVIIRRLVISLSLVSILLVYNPPEKFRNLYNLVLTLSIISAVLVFNAQLSWRVLAPAAVLGTVLLVNTSKHKSIIYFLLVLSTIPSLRIIYLLSIGQFHAA
ncbi:hypothetical protein [Yersinia similis]|uniref:hypothetical protein n=1 Tax=Yersinia similis TaxID=367190 RepID=UPI00384B340A